MISGVSHRKNGPAMKRYETDFFLFLLFLLYAHISAKKWRQISRCIVASFSSHSSMNKLGGDGISFEQTPRTIFLHAVTNAKSADTSISGSDLIQFIIKKAQDEVKAAAKDNFLLLLLPFFVLLGKKEMGKKRIIFWAKQKVLYLHFKLIFLHSKEF